MRDWRFWLAEQRGTLMAVGIFVVMFAIYASNHPAGFTANVVQTAVEQGDAARLRRRWRRRWW